MAGLTRLTGRKLIREMMGDRKLDPPQTAPTIGIAIPPLPGWGSGVYKIAVAFMYEESSSDLGPSANFSIAVIPEKPSITAFHSDASVPAGVRGYLIAITKAGKTDFFEIGRVEELGATAFTFPDTSPDDDLDQSILTFESKMKDVELNECLEYWNQQVNSRSFPIRKQLEVVTQATSGFALVTGANTVTRPSGSWIDDGYYVGGQYRASLSEDTPNDGVKTITNVTDLILTVQETLTVNASDTAMRLTLGIFYVGSQASYTLPPDVAVMNDETLVFADGIRLNEISDFELVKRVTNIHGTDTPTEGRPTHWYRDFDKTKIRFYPVPATADADIKVTLHYTKKLDSLSQDADELLGGEHEEFHRAIIYGCIGDLFRNRRNDNDADRFDRKHEEALAKLRQKLTSDKVQSPIFRPTICRGRPSRGSGNFADPQQFFRT